MSVYLPNVGVQGVRDMQADSMNSRSQTCRAKQPPPAAQPLPWHVAGHKVDAGHHEHQKAVFVQVWLGYCHQFQDWRHGPFGSTAV